MKFSNLAYEDLVKDLINDTFYIDSRSNRGKISTIRQYSEVVIRKLLDLPTSSAVTLGDSKIKKKLEAVNLLPLLMKTVDEIRLMGNRCSHTQYRQPVSDQEVHDAINTLFNLYACFFILYFKKYRFGSNNEVMSAFSILPPIIRFIVLDDLYKYDKQNPCIIDRLALALLKAFNEDDALNWIEKRKDELKNILAYTQEGIAEIESKYGKSCAKETVANAPENMYVLCLAKVTEVSSIINEQGLLYNNFEQAKLLYLEKGILSNDSEEHREFNDIMDFVYLGRKIEENEKLINQHLYNIII